MDNMKLWNAVKQPPATALKAIGGGRLKGMTDIKPQWRYLAMTEQYGICGIGWKYTVEKLWMEQGSGDQIAAFANILLYIKEDGVWSEGIPGNGGSMFVAKETNGLHTSDEAYKMAITDAMSTAMKLLGFAADVYMGGWTGSKYKDEPKEVIKITPDPVDEAKVFSSVVWFKEMIDADKIEETWEKVQRGYSKLSNNEKMALDAQLKDKAPNSNKSYRNLLKEYLNYRPTSL
jgi:hypothetical protein